MQKTWKSTAAGVLMIIAGIYMVLFLAPFLFIWGGMYPKITVSWVSSFVILIIGIMAVLSGIFTCRRKFWMFTIAGSVCAISACLINSILNWGILRLLTYDASSLIFALVPALLAAISLILLLALLSSRNWHISSSIL